jgi:hypothetical protein
VTDTIDLAQDQQHDIALALAGRAPRSIGRSHCANADCGEPIAPLRQQLGAVLCIDCQRDAERSAQACARGAV